MSYADPDRQRQAIRDAQSLRYRARSAWIQGVKDVPCADCGQKFPPECMDFDHTDPKTKFKKVSWLMSASMEKLQAEIAKCEIVCANCHRMRTKWRNMVDLD